MIFPSNKPRLMGIDNSAAQLEFFNNSNQNQKERKIYHKNNIKKKKKKKNHKKKMMNWIQIKQERDAHSGLLSTLMMSMAIAAPMADGPTAPTLVGSGADRWRWGRPASCATEWNVNWNGPIALASGGWFHAWWRWWRNVVSTLEHSCDDD